MNDTGIANMALGRLGVGQAIASLADQVNPSKTCNRFYDQCRQEVLRAFPWDFALRVVALAQVSGQSYPGYALVYQYPAACVMVRAISDIGGLRFSGASVFCQPQSDWPVALRQPWKMGLKDDDASKVILTDVSEAYAHFTADVSNTGVFPPDFVSAFADRLAMEVGGPLQCKADLIDRCEARYLRSLSTAAAQAMNESRDDEKAESPSISCRS